MSLLKLFTTIIVFAAAISCSKSSIVGKWKTDCLPMEGFSGKTLIEFRADNTGTLSINSFSDPACEKPITGSPSNIEITYKIVDESKLLMKGQGPEQTISYKLDGNRLGLQTVEGAAAFSRY